MNFVDIHTHKKPENQPFTIYNIDWQKADLFLAENPKAIFSAGFHPYFLKDFSENDLEKFAETIKNKHFFALGECGLDKNIDTSFEAQKNIFEKQISLSETLCKPLIIHCVGYFNELILLKKALKPAQKWLVHGFRGKPQLAEQLLKNDIMFSFGE
jgi:TatD DNase family protein